MSYATDFVNPLNGKRVWIKLHPDDDLVGLHPNYLTDPDLFKPHIHPYSNKYEAWGIGDFDDEDPQAPQAPNVLFKPLVRRAKVDQVLYFGMDYPQSQFVKHLVARKEKQLSLRTVGDRKNCDYVLRIRMPNIYDGEGKEFIQRLLKVSGGVTLNAFQDKILGPAMGWSRNYHAYLFIDRTDGALFGPEVATYGDLVHMPFIGHEFVSDSKYTIADLLEKPGCTLGYLYDLGDQWQHDIIVESIVPCSESTGRFELLEGSGACPGEDMKGNRTWNNALAKLRANPEDFRLIFELRTARNYEHGGHCCSWCYDPLRFDIAAARTRVQAALASDASNRQPFGPFGHFFDIPAFLHDPLSNTLEPVTLGMDPMMGQATHPGYHPLSLDPSFDGPFPNVPNQINPATRGTDPETQALCEQCGSPHGLRKCSKCKAVSYCSSSCQTLRWGDHKLTCKAPSN